MDAKILKFPTKIRPKLEAELSLEQKKTKEEEQRAANNKAVLKLYELKRPS